MYRELGIWIGIGLPIVIGVITAIVLALYTERKEPDA